MIPGYFTATQLAEQYDGSVDAFRSLGKKLKKLILINDQVIMIYAARIKSGIQQNQYEMLLDTICKNYQGQTIEVWATDGENLEFLNIINLLELVASKLAIPPDRIKLFTCNPAHAGKFSHVYKKADGTFYAPSKLCDPVSLPVATDAKFLGTIIGRFTPSRLRLAYELDCAFPADTEMTFQTLHYGVEELTWTSGTYDQEIAWAQTRKFKSSISTDLFPKVRPYYQVTAYSRQVTIESCQTYNTWAAQVHIDVVVETDVLQHWFFSEKVSRPLATGKPFVLLSGKGSLRLLRSWGFETFGDIIDESYDDEEIPTIRIEKMIHSLKQIYHSPNRQQILEQMNQRAQRNIAHFQEFHKSEADPNSLWY
jgi:hypothetical protein